MVFDGNITSKTQGFSFHGLTQDITSLIFVLFSFFFFTTFSPAPLSLFSSYIKFNLVSFSTIWPLYSERVQSHSSTMPVVKWIILVFEVNPLKKSLRGDILESSLPFFWLHLVLSGLIWSRRSEERPYGDEAMLIMWHHIWCVWSVCGQWGWPFDQELT